MSYEQGVGSRGWKEGLLLARVSWPEPLYPKLWWSAGRLLSPGVARLHFLSLHGIFPFGRPWAARGAILPQSHGQLGAQAARAVRAHAPSLLAAHPEAHSALRANAQAPLTPWDVYATLREFATYPNPPPSPPKALGDFPAGPPWARSLLRPLPRNRTCAELRVPKCRCVCDGAGGE